MKDILLKYGLTKEQTEKFILYKNLLTEKNKSINLTSITDEKEIAYKHFIDSLAVLKYVDLENKSLIDVGTGAGFPGLPLKIAVSSIKLTLLDSLKKRVDFLKETSLSLGLDDVSCIHARAEDAAADMGESFDFAISRAVAGLNVLAEYCLPFVKPGGYFIALKGPSPEGELNEAKTALSVLGGSLENIFSYSVYDFTHSLVFIKKTSPTPAGYPRSSAKIKKRPL